MVTEVKQYKYTTERTILRRLYNGAHLNISATQHIHRSLSQFSPKFSFKIIHKDCKLFDHYLSVINKKSHFVYNDNMTNHFDILAQCVEEQFMKSK